MTSTIAPFVAPRAVSESKSLDFSQRALSKLPPCPANASRTCDEYTDTNVIGLKLQVSKKGRKSFYFRYTVHGNKRAARIGEFPAIDVSEARKKALAMRAKVDQGIDPLAEHDTLKQTPTLRQFADAQYMPHARQTKRSAKDDESKLRIHILPKLGVRKLCDISTRDVQAYLNEIAAKLSQATANRHHALIARMYRLAVLWKITDHNPCTGLAKFKEVRHAERFLSPDEIARFMAAMAEDRNPVACAALRMLLLTGLRRSEVIKAKWDQVNLQERLIYLPRTKAGKPRYAVLNSAAFDLVNGLPSKGNSVWLFPLPNGSGPIDNPKTTLLRLLSRAGISAIRIHDLRHSFASTAINAGATLYEVQALLGHASPQMTMRYSHLAQESVRKASEVVAEVVTAATTASAKDAQAA